MARLDIGLRQARRMCQMSHRDRLTLIAEGLPIILESAGGFRAASLQLKDNPREADVLAGFAEEEAAKILILMDVVRCPPKLISSRLGTIVGWFYDHLARVIYAEATHWKPMDMAQLREYVDSQRKAHYLEGYVGEYILPNWHVSKRESQLYADIEVYEDGTLGWNSPTGHGGDCLPFTPSVLRVAEALSALGVFSPRGLDATATIFAQVEFKDMESHEDSERLTEALLKRLIAGNLPIKTATDEHVSALYDAWQMPMYNLEFSLIDVPLAQLEEERDAKLWAEAGYGPHENW